jgi:hypothetical protein
MSVGSHPDISSFTEGDPFARVVWPRTGCFRQEHEAEPTALSLIFRGRNEMSVSISRYRLRMQSHRHVRENGSFAYNIVGPKDIPRVSERKPWMPYRLYSAQDRPVC